MKPKLATFAILMLSAVGMAQADSSSSPFSRQDDSGNRTAAQRYDEETGPFTRDEARELSAIWSKIRDASSFADIDWKAVGLSRAPGDREAQTFVTAHWDSLRRAERFNDIDWRKEYGDR